MYDFSTVINRYGTDSEKYDSLERLYGKADLLPMWVADMDIACPPQVMDALKQRMEHPIFGYSKVPQGYFEAVTAYHNKRHGITIEHDWMFNTPGVVSGLCYLIHALTEPGDSLLVFPPVYYPFFSIVKDNGRTLVESPLVCDDKRCYTFDWADVESKLKAGIKAVILCSPHNPVSRVWTREELTQLVALCKQYGAMIFSDEIHCDITMSGHDHIPTQLIEGAADITVSLVAPSKTFNLAALQHSIAYTQNPAFKQAVIDKVFKPYHISCPPLGYIACQAAYEHCHDWVDELNATIEGNFIYLRDFIRDNLPMVHVTDLEGSYLMWADFRDIEPDHEALVKRLVERCGLALSDGYTFGAQQGNGFIRFNLGCPRATIEDAAQRLLKIV